MLEFSAGCRLADITDPLTLISVVSYNTSLKKENLCSRSSVHTPQSIPPSPGSPGKLATISFGRGRAVE